jgi:dihydroxyacetone kinase-like predicted kinase
MIVGACRTVSDQGHADLPQLLTVVAASARQAVARPVDGTMLTVADAAGEAARDAASGTPLAIAVAARDAARIALAATPDQLEVLAAAGVVDAGGQAYVLLLDVLVEVLGGEPAQALAVPAAARHRQVRFDRGTYEVMYALRGADRRALARLRSELDQLGESVVVVGDETIAQIHVHLTDPDAAVRPALSLGELSRIRVNALHPAELIRRRAVVAMVAGRGLADAVEAGGGTALRAAGGLDAATALQELLATDMPEMIILPNDLEHLEMAQVLARQIGDHGRRVAVIPTVAQAQGLAALAVHEPAADFEPIVSIMREAAFGTRHAAITIAEQPLQTMIGKAASGEVVGVLDGDPVLRGDDLGLVGTELIGRLLEPGGELLTMIIGRAGDVDLAHQLAEQARTVRPGIEVEVIDGGQDRYPLLIGVE